MIRAVSYSVWISIHLTILWWLCGDSLGQSVRFDCPSVAAATIVDQHSFGRIVEVVIPVSTTVSDSKLVLQEIQTEVYWNRNAYPIVKYEPLTSLQSKYEGPIAIEKNRETSYKLGADLSSSYLDFATPTLNAGVGWKNAEIKRFSEIPQHQWTVASGTIKRGTGAYFQFKPSRTETLEGGRDLTVAYDVPESWRGGVLQINCRAFGKRKVLGLFGESFEHSRVFVVPVYLQGDQQAREFALEFARSEQRLRYGWSQYQNQLAESNANPAKLLFSNEARVSGLWVHQLIQSGSDIAIEKVESQLPKKVANAANEFVRARQNLISISR